MVTKVALQATEIPSAAVQSQLAEGRGGGATSSMELH